jgi:diaminopimelate epimerase
MNIPFTKAHGARNDFLLTWRDQLPSTFDASSAAVAICDRHTGAGADGWLLVSGASEADGAIELWNSDGSRSEISGNGTRCAAAFLIEANRASENVRIMTGAGLKHLRLLNRDGFKFSFEMNMGAAKIESLRSDILDHDATILNVGNPQCAVFVDHFDFDWRSLGAAIERHWQFPNRTNVSFIRLLDQHTLYRLDRSRRSRFGARTSTKSGSGSYAGGSPAITMGQSGHPSRWTSRDSSVG